MKLRILSLIIAVTTIMACKKDEVSSPSPIDISVKTLTVSGITDTTAVVSAEVKTGESGTVLMKGICWSMNPDPVVSGSKSENGNGGGTFSDVMNDLEPGTTYYVRAYATTATKTYYGNTLSFSTTFSGAGTVRFVFENYVDAEPLQLGLLQYINEAGNTYSVDMLKYYVSNMKYEQNGQTIFSAPNYELINQSVPASASFDVLVPSGQYDSFRFLLGVDSVRNVSGAQTGALDPIYGMFWDWNTGYIYFKHEGSFIEASGDTLPLVYHYGALPALKEHSFNQNLNIVAGQLITVTVRFNLNKLYRAPNVIDFTNNNIHSGGNNFITTLRENFQDALTVISVQ